MSQASSSNAVPHRVVPTLLKQPTTICFKPSRPPLSLPQVPSSDAVPYHTSRCTAMLATAIRCKQLNNNRETTPDHQQESICLGHEVDNPLPIRLDVIAAPVEAAIAPNRHHRNGYLETTPPREATMPIASSSSLVQTGQGFHSETQCSRVVSPKNDTPNGESDI